MSVKRVVETTTSSLYLTEELPVCVNRISESFRLQQHKHEFVEFNYVSEGSGFQHIEGETIPVAKGDLFFVPVGASHVFRPASPTPGRSRLIVYNCLFNDPFITGLMNGLQLDEASRRQLGSSYPEQTWLHVQDRNGIFERSFNIMFEEYRHRKPGFLALIQAEVVRVLIHMNRLRETENTSGDCKPGLAAGATGMPLALSSAYGVADRPATFMQSNMEVITDRIREMPAEATSIQELAAEAGLSERHFRRRFAAYAGMSYIDFVHKSRIEACCRQLLETTDKVSVIARRIGYQDMKFFNALFKKKTGLTPSEYRAMR